MPKKIIITGYYKKDNTGDDIFEKVANKLFISNKQYEYNILSIDQLKSQSQGQILIDSIILFGGETLNEYFLSTLSLIKNQNQHIKLYALGVGLGADIDELKYYIPMFQYITVRHKTDLYMITNKFPNIRCDYIQDIAFKYKIKAYKEKDMKKINNNKTIGLFLSQPKYHSLKIREKHQDAIYLLNSYISLITGFVNNGYNVKLFSMCHNNIESESDVVLNNLLFNSLEKKIRSYVKIVSSSGSGFNSNQNFENNLLTLKYAICERFHSHILCLIYNIPFVSLGNTLKVTHLLNDLELNKTICNPFDFNFNIINKKLISINNKELKDIYKSIYPRVEEFYSKFSVDNNEYNKIGVAKNKIQLYLNDKQITNFCINFLNEFNHIHKKLNFPADYILMKLFGTNKLDYKWGIEEKLNTKHFNINDVKWLFEQSIMNHLFLFNTFSSNHLNPYNNHLNTNIHNNHLVPYKKSPLLNRKNNNNVNSISINGNLEDNIKNQLQLYNIDYIDQYDRTGIHRHGWKYVIDNFSNNLCSYDTNNNLIKCDLYVDRTFHWDREVMIEAGVIPYKSNWVGFIHHTLYQDESGYNCVELLKCKEFIESLKFCKALIVLSNYLKEQLLKLAILNDIQLPVIHTIFHPTYFVDESKLWKYGKWKFASWKGEVIQIGSWMRDIKAIYDLKYDNKYVLIGKQMEDKYKAISFGDNNDTNILESNIHNVTVVNYLENDMYDDMLTRYVVFLKLKDASAVNTVLECIVRNTPIIVNRLPAIEEYLGPDYPLYYNDIDEVPRMLKNKKLIIKANTYLSNMNKDFLKIENFITSMKNLIVHNNMNIKIVPTYGGCD